MFNNKKAAKTPATPTENESQITELASKPKKIIFEDILPSFEMYDFIFNRSMVDNEEPPTYENDNNLLSQSGIESLNPTSDPDLSIINNIDDAQCIDLPIKISIVLTKEPPKTNQPLNQESKFKLYKPGDAVTGYITIENTSDEPIKFDMFLVSLEGNITTKSFYSDLEKNKLFRKKFLKMYDLCACYHLPAISLGPTGDRNGESCPETGAVYGFMDENVLLPRKKYQKDFLFQLPETLLDTVCEHQSPEHLMTPSSFGVDTECFNGKGANIQVNNSLGYDMLSDIPGSPIKIRDLASGGQSVSYSINTKMVAIHLEHHKKFCITDKIFTHNFAILQQQQHFFSVSTAGSSLNLSDSNWFFKSNISTDDQVDQLQRLCDNTIDELRFKNDLIQAEVTDRAEQDRMYNNNSTIKKQSQLETSINNRETLKPKLHSSDVGFIENLTSGTLVKSLFNKYEGNLSISVCSSDNISINSFFIPKLKNLFIKDNNESMNDIPYISPTVSKTRPGLSPTGSKSKLNVLKAPLSPIDSLFDSYFSKKILTPATSNKSTKGFFADDNKSASDKITISLTFNPKNNSPPPDSISINPSLGVLNFQSESEIPIRIDNQFLLDSSVIGTAYWKISRIKNKMLDNMDKFHELTKENNLKIPKTLYRDVTSMTKITLLAPFVSIFEKIEKTGLVWSKEKNGIYNTTFEIDLVINEKKVEKVGISIIPNFQTCLLSRLYSVKLEFGCLKGNFKEHTVFATLPLTVT